MTQNDLVKLGFKNEIGSILDYCIKETHNFTLMIYSDYNELNNEGVSLSMFTRSEDMNVCVYNIDLPNIKTISQLKTFIKLISNE